MPPEHDRTSVGERVCEESAASVVVRVVTLVVFGIFVGKNALNLAAPPLFNSVKPCRQRRPTATVCRILFSRTRSEFFFFLLFFFYSRLLKGRPLNAGTRCYVVPRGEVLAFRKPAWVVTITHNKRDLPEPCSRVVGILEFVKRRLVRRCHVHHHSFAPGESPAFCEIIIVFTPPPLRSSSLRPSVYYSTRRPSNIYIFVFLPLMQRAGFYRVFSKMRVSPRRRSCCRPIIYLVQ